MVLSCPLTWTSSVLWQHVLTGCVCVCSSLYMKTVSSYTVNYAHAQRVTICCHNTDLVHVNGHDRTILVILAKNCTVLPDDASSVIRNMLGHF